MLSSKDFNSESSGDQEDDTYDDSTDSSEDPNSATRLGVPADDPTDEYIIEIMRRVKTLNNLSNKDIEKMCYETTKNKTYYESLEVLTA